MMQLQMSVFYRNALPVREGTLSSCLSGELICENLELRRYSLFCIEVTVRCLTV